MATRSARTTSNKQRQCMLRQPQQASTPLTEIETEGFPISAWITEGEDSSSSSIVAVCCRMLRQPHYETTPIRKIARRHADTAPMGMRTLSPSFMIGKSNTVSVLLSGLHASLQFAIHTLLRFF